MNKQFKEILDRVHALNDMQYFPHEVIVPALVHLEARLEEIEDYVFNRKEKKDGNK